MKKVRFSSHAHKRMTQDRQQGIAYSDVESAALSLGVKNIAQPGFKIRDCKARSGRIFDVVVVDKEGYREIITVVGLNKKDLIKN